MAGHASGSALYASFGGTLITGDQRAMSWESSVNLIDTTAGADVAESHVTGTTNASISIDWLVSTDAAGSATNSALAEKNSGTLLWGNYGTAAGSPKYGCVATVESVSQDAPYDDVLSKSASLTRNGNWLFNYDTLGSTW